MPTFPDDLASWMRFIPDDYSVTKLTIPGTHDSHATSENYYIPPLNALLPGAQVVSWVKKKWAVTQSEPIIKQLNMGVRYLDFRIGHPDFSMFHGECRLNNNLRETCQWVDDWLGQHPTETVLIAVKWDEDGKAQPPDFAAAVWSMWKSKKDGGHGWYSDTKWPKLKDVRGKAVLLRRYIDDKPMGIDAWEFWGKKQRPNDPGKWDQQDNGMENNMGSKVVWQKVVNQLNHSQNQPFGDDVMHFTGLAQSGTNGTPKDYADVINPGLMKVLHNGHSSRIRYGVIILDYITRSHAITIVSQNWDAKTYAASEKKVWTSGSNTPVAEYTHWNGDKVSIMFQDDANLVVHRNADVVWKSDKTTVQANNHTLEFQSDGNLVIYKHGDTKVPSVWKSDTNHSNSRLRFMSGPPYIMIDTDGDNGEVWWTTCPW